MDSCLHSTVSCWAEIENCVFLCVYTHSNPRWRMWWPGKAVAEVDHRKTGGCLWMWSCPAPVCRAEWTRAGCSGPNPAGFWSRVPMLELTLLKVLKSVLGSQTWSMEWFYLLSTFSNAFPGIKIHKCDICILRYLMFFIFLPGSQKWTSLHNLLLPL